ncbi:bifunctional 4-hydroxy-2-oxoglutarate aldolase/2-dehydro-3-deoxy-phosphogluconate aldolase [Flavivirga sp. 57AJ16]|uniref:bifunctional 4-hydroxy-2-oxoglutarate aldolase/2-dehydro-3-deoxy-phosphogluconate aldolase n=1 Tax=Flavivirga sp. 57AJ16 TaxID=3025307 RepID=UPI0023650569|nr:bifunctional 4-hydroxy-2-oxoglutarate aldolase/2-dehydro-3-deoxy-phosphogluconate aldolase [Flavivirga sp. 57AJ16]MDD7887517.1 bifunctional 4-hydroxy-2-oxoglutarate aldolase/2-dehydro-3-deoxy-phosphogluconate aldolase [Flavivirga sp. 57AJ16]
MNKNVKKADLPFSKTGVIPLFYHDDLEVCKRLIRACYEGGIKEIEFTNRGSNAHEVFKELLSWSATAYPDLVLGIGTIKTVEDAQRFIAIGARFIVTPILDTNVGQVCKEHNIPWIPGCFTLSEMYTAYQNGATLVKVFPVDSLGGSKFIKSVLSPCPELKLMPSGGIKADKEDVKAYLNAGVHCVGIGSSLFKRNKAGEFNYQAISETCKEILNVL